MRKSFKQTEESQSISGWDFEEDDQSYGKNYAERLIQQTGFDRRRKQTNKNNNLLIKKSVFKKRPSIPSNESLRLPETEQPLQVDSKKEKLIRLKVLKEKLNINYSQLIKNFKASLLKTQTSAHQQKNNQASFSNIKRSFKQSYTQSNSQKTEIPRNWEDFKIEKVHKKIFHLRSSKKQNYTSLEKITSFKQPRKQIKIEKNNSSCQFQKKILNKNVMQDGFFKKKFISFPLFYRESSQPKQDHRLICKSRSQVNLVMGQLKPSNYPIEFMDENIFSNSVRVS